MTAREEEQAFRVVVSFDWGNTVTQETRTVHAADADAARAAIYYELLAANLNFVIVHVEAAS